MTIIYGMLFIIVLGSIYVLCYYLNHKTPKPKGCEEMTSACEGCHVTTCENNPVREYKESKNA